MALPTIRFHNTPAGANSSTVENFMTALHTEIIAAGWTIEYADSDAIGGGSAGTPAWDKSPVINTDAGVVVYKMPKNGHDTNWFVRLRPGWAANVNRPHMRGITIGTTHDGTGGVTGGTTELTPGVAATQSDNRQILLAASEDGFALHLIFTNNVNVIVERARRSDTGVVTDDILAFVSYGSGSGRSALIRAGVGAVHTHDPVALGGFNNGITAASFGSGVSLESYAGSHIPIVGPYWLRGHPFWHGRHSFLVSFEDHPVDSDRSIVIDGASRVYKVNANGEQGNLWARWAVATE